MPPLPPWLQAQLHVALAQSKVTKRNDPTRKGDRLCVLAHRGQTARWRLASTAKREIMNKAAASLHNIVT